MQDITREELKDWLNKNAYGVADAFGKGVGLGFHPFLYPKNDPSGLLIMKYNRAGQDEILGTVVLPPGTLRYAATRDVLAAKALAKREWWQPHIASGRHFLQHQRQPYPTRPQSLGTLFYVLRDEQENRFLTYPDTEAVRTFNTLPEARAARELASRTTGHYFRVISVVDNKENCAHDETNLSETFLEHNGWCYAHPAA